MIIQNGFPVIHPGEYLAEILEELHLSQVEFARAIGVSSVQISHIIHGKRRVTAELALLFAKAFEQSPEYWLNLQLAYDLKTAEKQLRTRLSSIPNFVQPSL